MFFIVVHHSVVNSPLHDLVGNDFTINNIFLKSVGYWGKTGINCFILISGYFMINRSITIKKYILYLLEVIFYKTVFFIIFEDISIVNYLKFVFPFRTISDDFVSCFLIFYLLIPFVNRFLEHLDKKEYAVYFFIVFFFYSLLPSLLNIKISFNYVTWFIFIYSIGSYIKIYENESLQRNEIWIPACLASLLLSILSLLFLPLFGYHKTLLLQDCNKVLAITNAITSFIVFKNIKIPYNKTINSIASTTFGILLIHTISDSIRKYLWFDLIDLTKLYYSKHLPLYLLGYCFVIFAVCFVIDIVRKNIIEKLIKKI